MIVEGELYVHDLGKYGKTYYFVNEELIKSHLNAGILNSSGPSIKTDVPFEEGLSFVCPEWSRYKADFDINFKIIKADYIFLGEAFLDTETLKVYNRDPGLIPEPTKKKVEKSYPDNWGEWV